MAALEWATELVSRIGKKYNAFIVTQAINDRLTPSGYMRKMVKAVPETMSAPATALTNRPYGKRYTPLLSRGQEEHGFGTMRTLHRATGMFH